MAPWQVVLVDQAAQAQVVLILQVVLTVQAVLILQVAVQVSLILQVVFAVSMGPGWKKEKALAPLTTA